MGLRTVGQGRGWRVPGKAPGDLCRDFPCSYRGGRRFVLLTSSAMGDINQDHFALVICCSVLEHVRKPWLFADNPTRVVKPGGPLYMSVPWVWRYHAYPDDYFRFSPRGVEALFEEFSWSELMYSTSADGEFVRISTQGIDSDNRMAVMAKTNDSARKYLPYLMVNMLGRRRA